MSGIVGIIGSGTPDELRALANHMTMRGPLQEPLAPVPGVLLGQCDRRGAPRADSDRAVGYGHIDNADELRDALARHTNRPISADGPELVAQLVEAFGLDALARIRGFFAAAFWDPRERAVIIACDTAGFCATHFTELGGRIAFATDYKAFFALPDFAGEPDRDGLQFYVATRTYRFLKPNLRGVARVTAGDVLVCRDGRCELRSYWRPTVALAQRSLAGHAAAVREQFMAVVGRQTRGHTRIGVALSGGLDSPSVLAAVRQVRPEAEVLTYTIGRDHEDPEILGARRVAEHFRTRHHSIVFEPERIPLELPRLIWSQEDAGGREEALLEQEVARKAAGNVSLLMGGWGADVEFGGMPRHRLLRMRSRLPMLKTPLGELFRYTQGGPPPETWAGRVLKDYVYRGADYPPPAILGASGPASRPVPASLTEACTVGLMTNTTWGYMEPAIAAAHLRLATPFLDPDFIDLSFTIPERYKITWREQKLVLRRAMRGLLPPYVLGRPKAIQRLHHDARLSEILDQMSGQLLAPAMVRARGFVDEAYVARVRRRPPGGAFPTEQMYRLWTLLALEIWARLFLDGRGATPPP